MINDELTIEFDARLHLARLRIGGNRPDVAAVVLPHGFELEDIREALLASNYVRESGETFRLAEHVGAEYLSEMVSAMLAQFDSPGVPGDSLLQLQTIVDDYQSGTGSSVDVPWMAIAWLDFVVRQDIAEESRDSDEIWSKPKFVVDTKSHKERRLAQLVKRFSPASAPLRRMTPSSTKLPAEHSSQSATG